MSRGKALEKKRFLAISGLVKAFGPRVHAICTAENVADKLEEWRQRPHYVLKLR